MSLSRLSWIVPKRWLPNSTLSHTSHNLYHSHPTPTKQISKNSSKHCSNHSRLISSLHNNSCFPNSINSSTTLPNPLYTHKISNHHFSSTSQPSSIPTIDSFESIPIPPSELKFLDEGPSWPGSLHASSMERDACGVGMIANIGKESSRNIIESANKILVNMTHRGGAGRDRHSGDGAGMLTGICSGMHKFFEKNIDSNVTLPKLGSYGVGNIFFAPNEEWNQQLKKMFMSKVKKDFGYDILTFRRLPVNSEILGIQSKASEPVIEQMFISNTVGHDSETFESNLFLIRHILEDSFAYLPHKATEEICHQKKYFYICSLSSKTLCYKGQFTPAQLFQYYLDLQSPDFESYFALVHSRYSTNTFPTWCRAQPNRVSCHNGEINTLRGNKNWMHSRLSSQVNVDGDNSHAISPYTVCNDDLSDSANFDNVLELLTKLSGSPKRNVAESIITMIPEAWENDKTMGEEKKKMYEYLSCIMEPWDGPALMAFCDGNYIGAMLDRNGLRPSRYCITADNNIVFSSETGVLPELHNSDNIIQKGRLEPGKILLIDFQEKRVISDKEIKSQIASKRPYKEWVEQNLVYMQDLIKNYKLKDSIKNNEAPTEDLKAKLRFFGFTTEGVQLLLIPMHMHGKEALGSMGNDASLSILSNQPRKPFDYFKQLFAQVTNPPIDPIREKLVMSLQAPVGPQQSIFDQTEDHCRRLVIEHPILTLREMEAIKDISQLDDTNYWKPHSLDCTFEALSGKERFISRLDEICLEAENAINNGANMIILSDKLISKDRYGIPSLIGLGCMHHHLIKKRLRDKVALFVECGDAKEVHHFCTLLGYGADAICPYMSYELFKQLERDGMIPKSEQNQDNKYAYESYRNAVTYGILKVLSKMGISTLQGYKGAQIFEAVGLHQEVVDKCFVGTASRIGGATFGTIYNDITRFHSLGFDNGENVKFGNEEIKENNIGYQLLDLPNPGMYHFRDKKENHFNTPGTIANLQAAVKTNSQDLYDKYSKESNEQAEKVTIRGLLDFNENLDGVEGYRGPIPLISVEPVESIMRRFNTGAMSLGSISRETHEDLARAMNTIGGRSNTGEGGEDGIRYNDVNRRSAIKQVASGRFGVTVDYLTNADQIQIKIAQGAKPGEGGELPGYKVDGYIGKLRHTTPGVTLISPPPHHDIYSIEDLAQLIFDLKQCNPEAEISVKLVSEIGVGVVAAGVAKARAHHITISGHDGGTGASAWTGIKHAGLPWELGLAEAHQTLILNDLRENVVLQTDGQLKTGRDVAMAALLGAEEFGFATVPLITLGCIMMRKCHLNTCPVGIATQDPELRKKYAGQPDHVINFFYFLANEVRGIMANLGFEKMDDMVGRSDYLTVKDCNHILNNSKQIDLKPLLVSKGNIYNKNRWKFVDNGLDSKLIELCRDMIFGGRDEKSVSRQRRAVAQRVRLRNIDIYNTNRAVGAQLSHRISKEYGSKALDDDSIIVHFSGTAGQSFGMCLNKGVTFLLEGEGNDFVGKSLSGGVIAVYPNRRNGGLIRREADRNVIAGNACLYGATSGKVFLNGRAGERFAVRNSGALAVVEGVGNHGCEYMTGGIVVILGNVGKNFGAGMSGGVAYVLREEFVPESENDVVDNYINADGIEVNEKLNDWDIEQITDLLEEHIRHTGSLKARRIMGRLLDGDETSKRDMFMKLLPLEYKKILDQKMKEKKAL